GGNYNSGGAPGTNTTINTVSVTVPAAAVGTGAAQAMTTNSASGTSFYDGFAFCNLPSQLYIGGFYRQTGANTGSATATVTATSPVNLTNAGGNTIPLRRSVGPAAEIRTPALSHSLQAHPLVALRRSERSTAISGPKVATRFL